MPTTLQYRPALIDELITTARINSYSAVFSPANDIELVGVYLWNMHVCGAIYPILSAAEIALRNSIDQTLTQHIGRFWWSGSNLRYNSFVPGGPVPFAVKALRDNFAKASDSYRKDRRKRYNHQRPPLTHNGVVSKTDFSTWGFILDQEFMGNNMIWPSRLGTVFSGPWPSTQASTVLSHARDLVSTTRDFRNRVFHHEPAWKRFGVRTEADALQHLQEKLAKVENLITLINPEKTKLLEKNGLLPTARRACTSQEIRRFQHLATTNKIQSMRHLVVLADLCGDNNHIVRAKVSKGSQREFLLQPI